MSARKVMVELTMAEAKALENAAAYGTSGLDGDELLDTFGHAATIRAFARADRKLNRAIMVAAGRGVVEWDGR